MTKAVDSDALGLINKALGLTGSGSAVTELTDGVVDQVLDVAPVVRRGRTQAGTGGLYSAVMRNSHAVADVQVTTANIYALTSGVGRFAPWPDPMPPQFDIWLLYASARITAGGGTFLAQLGMDLALSQQGWGLDEAGDAVAQTGRIVFTNWEGSIVNSPRVTGVIRGGSTLANIGVRLPRSPSTRLVFTSTSDQLATFICDLVLGVFPVTLGQDGLI